MKKIIFCSLAAIMFAAASFSSIYANYLTEPSLSPDRKEIVFVSGGDIWSVPASGGTASLLVSHPANESKPMFSPDGRYLAFSSNRTGNGDIYLLTLADGNLKRLTFDDAFETLDSWSRDGKWLYFSSTSRDLFGMNDIHRVAVTGGTPMSVSSDRYLNEFGSTQLADGSMIFAARGISSSQWWRRGRSHIDETEIWKYDGKNYSQITERGAKQLWPMATADGSRLYYVSDRDGQQNIWSHPSGGTPKKLTNFKDGRVLFASLSYDGQEIVFERDFKIWKMPVDGAAATVAISLRGSAANTLTARLNLSSRIREMALSPDGEKLALIARGEVFVAPAIDGGDAKLLTDTAAAESFVSWDDESQKVIYTSERDGQYAIYEYNFGTNTEYKINTGGNDYGAIYSPDGKMIAFIRDGRSLMIYDVEKKTVRQAAKIFTDPPSLYGNGIFQWSPDGKWIAFLSLSPETRSYTNAHVVSTDGKPARAISFLANSFSGAIVWDPKGKYVIFDSSQRTENSILARIDLEQKTPEFSEDKLDKLFKQENPQDKVAPEPAQSPTPVQNPTATPTPAATPAKATGTAGAAPPSASKKDDKEENQTKIDFANIRQRLTVLDTQMSSQSPVIKSDGKSLLFFAVAQGQFNLYTMSLDELDGNASPRQVTYTSGFKSSAQFNASGTEVFYLENGRVNIANLIRRDSRPLNINISINTDFAKEKNEVFKQGWRYMRDNFYDDKYHGVDWEGVRKTYEPLIASAKSIDEVRRLMNLMVGELNASHLGVGGSSGFFGTPIGKLGVRFDRAEFENAGRLKITEIITLGPAAVTKKIAVGDFITHVDGTKIDKNTNIDQLLEDKVDARVSLTVSKNAAGTGGEKISVKPVSTSAEKYLLYRQWVETNREYVNSISGGKLGYVHLPDMSSNSLDQLYIDLDAENQSKEGVVVDIRNNNGGFINVYVVDILSRRGYLTMRERGLWNVPARAALGQRSLERPTVLVTNQHSLSDAEDLTEGYRTLKLGKVVGEPTSGWIIYTWGGQLFDGTSIRLPRQLILGSDGKNMELNPRQVDVPVTRPVGETLTGKDSQLDQAVKELLGTM